MRIEEDGSGRVEVEREGMVQEGGSVGGEGMEEREWMEYGKGGDDVRGKEGRDG